MLENLYITKSKIRQDLLALFFTNPSRRYYLRELERILGYSAGNIRRELLKFQIDNLFNTQKIGNLKYYSINSEHPIYNELKSIVFKTIGEFYKEKVLSMDNKRLVDIGSNSGHIRIVNEVFGWILYNGKRVIECRSENEARYLKLFMELGLNKVYVPEDAEYLNVVLSELESMKRRTDEIIDERLRSILNPRIREEIRQDVYNEITK